MSLKRRFSLWAPVFAWCAVIFVVSSIPDPGGAPSDLPELMSRKLAHVIEYGILGLLVGRALAASRPAHRVLLPGLAFCFLVAAADEIHQTFVPGRFGKVRDVALDTLGAALALSLHARRRMSPIEVK